MIKIIVDTQELKDKILDESEYIHNFLTIEEGYASTLMHIYMNPDLIEVKGEIVKLKMEQCPLMVDCLHRQTKCGECVDKDQYDWDYTQMI